MEIAAIVIAAVGSSGLFSLIQYLIHRKDEKNDTLSAIRKDVGDIKDQLKVNEKDSCRTQMLLLMADYPEQTEEILKLGQHYFAVLGADWYLTTLFAGWLKQRGLEKPLWFDIHKGE